MGSFGGTTFTLLLAALADWREGRRAELRADLLRRYIGFPIWDAITYPLTVEHGVGERDGQIELYRVSPRETQIVQPPDRTKPKLAGMATHHFGAFFARPGREQDYLWGRIDGCCQLVALLDRQARRGRPGVGDRREGVHARRVRRRARGGVEPRPERSRACDAPVDTGHRQAHAG